MSFVSFISRLAFADSVACPGALVALCLLGRLCGRKLDHSRSRSSSQNPHLQCRTTAAERRAVWIRQSDGNISFQARQVPLEV
jgi:hypothetical protein